ncbi:MAG: hypothetical protein AB1Z98_11100 [Nannocystaceae bacterium]
MTTWRAGACALVISIAAAGCSTTSDQEEADQARCEDARIGAGVLGVVERRTCDIGPSSECLEPDPRRIIRFYDRNAQVSDGSTDTGTLDPDAIEVASAESTVNGTYEVELPLGATYYACDFVFDDTVSCSRPLQITDETPLLLVDYESGNGSLWYVRACDE